MSAHRTLNDLFRAFDAVGPGHLEDPGDAGTITVKQWGQICSVVTTAAQTRTLAQPTKAGVMAAVVLDTDGGDLTLTVTGGYDTAGDTSIVFGDAGDFVVFYSIKVGTSYYWRVLQSVGTDVKSEATTIGDAVTAEHGAGAIGTAFAPRTYRYTRDGDIITEIHIDITGLLCKGDAQGDAIGLSTGAAYIGRYVTATCGIVYRIEMICLEAPGEETATITADIDLMAENDDDVAYDGAVDDTVIAKGGSWAAGHVAVANTPALTPDDYLYLGEGDTAATTGKYSAGQFIIRLYGHPALA